MFYSMYLQSVCQRRQWPDPLYEPYRYRSHYYCKVRVNNREYCTDVPYKTEALAKEGAAMNAYMICRNFSHNDGMFPGQRPGHRSATGVVQGLPVAIGTGRRGPPTPCVAYHPSSNPNNPPTGGPGTVPAPMPGNLNRHSGSSESCTSWDASSSATSPRASIDCHCRQPTCPYCDPGSPVIAAATAGYNPGYGRATERAAERAKWSAWR